jgi:hypothetical protein
MSDPTQATVLSALEDAEVAAAQTGGSSTDRTTGLILRYALEWALAHADVELVAFLAGLEGQWVSGQGSVTTMPCMSGR